MKIGFDAKRCFRNSTGLGNYSRHVIDMLANKPEEFELHLYTPKMGEAYPSLPSSAHVHLPTGLWQGPLKSAWRTTQVSKDAARDGIDLYHGLSNEIPIGLAKAKIPSIVTIHDLIFERFPEYYRRIDRNIYRRKFKSGALNATKVVAVSEQSKLDLINFYHIPEDKIEVIYQDCHPAFGASYSDAQKAAVQEKYNLPSEFLLQVGTLERRKNAGNTVKALNFVPDIPLVVVGRSTDYWTAVLEEAKKEGTHRRIMHLKVDGMEDLAIINELATVFVYPSHFEGFGIPIIEALRAGTPVVTTHNGVFPEAGGPSSIYVDPLDPESIAAGINLLLSNSELRNSVSTDGLKYSENFRSSELLKQWTSLYHQLID